MLYYYIGMPRSGKSTTTDKWLKKQLSIRDKNEVEAEMLPLTSLNGKPRVVVCEDDIRIALHGKAWIGRAEPFVHAISHTMIRAYLDRGFDVLVDETHSKPQSIKELFRIDKHAKGIFFPFRPNKEEKDKWVEVKNVCLERAKLTNQEYLMPVIERIFHQTLDLASDFEFIMESVKEELRMEKL